MKADALAFINEAIDALSVKGFSSPAEPVTDWSGEEMPPEWTPIPAIRLTQGVHLERVDAAIGPRGESMFWDIAQRIDQAMIALHAAKDSLG